MTDEHLGTSGIAQHYTSVASNAEYVSVDGLVRTSIPL